MLQKYSTILLIIKTIYYAITYQFTSKPNDPGFVVREFFSIIDITKQTNGGQNKRARWSLPFKPIFTSFTRELSLKIQR